MILMLIAGCASDDADRADSDAMVADTLRILAYNIHHAEGMDEILDLQRIADLIKKVDPDLVALQEVDSVVVRTNGVDQAAVLAEMTGMESVFGRFMPYQGGAYGMALLSRLPVRSSINYRLPDGDEPRSALSAVVELPGSGQLLRFIGIHFYRTEEERLAQAMKLEELIGMEQEMPTLLAGDFNSEPGTAVLNHLEQGWHVLDKGEDNLTFSSFNPVKEIDFFMWRPVNRFVLIDQDVLDEPVISDHRPLVLDVAVTTAH